MNILITGGAGYIGLSLIKQLINKEVINQIVIYDNLERKNYNLFIGKSFENTNKIKFVKGDILDTRKLKNEIDNADVVFHLAAKVNTPFSDSHSHGFDQINNWGTAELTYLLEASTVKKFIHLSSISVYGSSNNEVDITSPLNPKTFYGISKLKGEKHASRLLNSNIETYIIRSGNVYGYNKAMRFDAVINKFMFEANFFKKIQIFGSGNQYRSFIHVERLSYLLSEMIFSDLKPDIYNVTEFNLSLNQVVENIAKLYPELETIYVNQDIKMREIKVRQDSRLQKIIPTKSNFLEDLKEFSNNFTF